LEEGDRRQNSGVAGVQELQEFRSGEIWVESSFDFEAHLGAASQKILQLLNSCNSCNS
jgi:hypothetical protein